MAFRHFGKCRPLIYPTEEIVPSAPPWCRRRWLGDRHVVNATVVLKPEEEINWGQSKKYCVTPRNSIQVLGWSLLLKVPSVGECLASCGFYRMGKKPKESRAIGGRARN